MLPTSHPSVRSRAGNDRPAAAAAAARSALAGLPSLPSLPAGLTRLNLPGLPSRLPNLPNLPNLPGLPSLPSRAPAVVGNAGGEEIGLPTARAAAPPAELSGIVVGVPDSRGHDSPGHATAVLPAAPRLPPRAPAGFRAPAREASSGGSRFARGFGRRGAGPPPGSTISTTISGASDGRPEHANTEGSHRALSSAAERAAREYARRAAAEGGGTRIVAAPVRVPTPAASWAASRAGGGSDRPSLPPRPARFVGDPVWAQPRRSSETTPPPQRAPASAPPAAWQQQQQRRASDAAPPPQRAPASAPPPVWQQQRRVSDAAPPPQRAPATAPPPVWQHPQHASEAAPPPRQQVARAPASAPPPVWHQPRRATEAAPPPPRHAQQAPLMAAPPVWEQPRRATEAAPPPQHAPAPSSAPPPVWQQPRRASEAAPPPRHVQLAPASAPPPVWQQPRRVTETAAPRQQVNRHAVQEQPPMWQQPRRATETAPPPRHVAENMQHHPTRPIPEWSPSPEAPPQLWQQGRRVSESAMPLTRIAHGPPPYIHRPQPVPAAVWAGRRVSPPTHANGNRPSQGPTPSRVTFGTPSSGAEPHPAEPPVWARRRATETGPPRRGSQSPVVDSPGLRDRVTESRPEPRAFQGPRRATETAPPQRGSHSPVVDTPGLRDRVTEARPEPVLAFQGARRASESAATPPTRRSDGSTPLVDREQLQRESDRPQPSQKEAVRAESAQKEGNRRSFGQQAPALGPVWGSRRASESTPSARAPVARAYPPPSPPAPGGQFAWEDDAPADRQTRDPPQRTQPAIWDGPRRASEGSHLAPAHSDRKPVRAPVARAYPPPSPPASTADKDIKDSPKETADAVWDGPRRASESAAPRPVDRAFGQRRAPGSSERAAPDLVWLEPRRVTEAPRPKPKPEPVLDLTPVWESPRRATDGPQPSNRQSMGSNRVNRALFDPPKPAAALKAGAPVKPDRETVAGPPARNVWDGPRRASESSSGIGGMPVRAIVRDELRPPIVTEPPAVVENPAPAPVSSWRRPRRESNRAQPPPATAREARVTSRKPAVPASRPVWNGIRRLTGRSQAARPLVPTPQTAAARPLPREQIAPQHPREQVKTARPAPAPVPAPVPAPAPSRNQVPTPRPARPLVYAQPPPSGPGGPDPAFLAEWDFLRRRVLAWQQDALTLMATPPRPQRQRSKRPAEVARERRAAEAAAREASAAARDADARSRNNELAARGMRNPAPMAPRSRSDAARPPPQVSPNNDGQVQRWDSDGAATAGHWLLGAMADQTAGGTAPDVRMAHWERAPPEQTSSWRRPRRGSDARAAQAHGTNPTWTTRPRRATEGAPREKPLRVQRYVSAVHRTPELRIWVS